MNEQAGAQAVRLDAFAGSLEAFRQGSAKQLIELRESIERKLSAAAVESTSSHGLNREEQGRNLKAFGETLLSQLAESASLQRRQFDSFALALASMSQANEQRMDKLRETVETRLTALQTDNAAKLDQMRATVDEKLHAALEQRLGESFKQVSDRLEQVHKGLGEMQTLASGVGDLKKVLGNIKTRGTWGEIQLGNLLEQMLTPGQYEANVQVNPATADRVEYAIKLPGQGEEKSQLWLPIDAKFPQEDYQRLVEAADRGDNDGITSSAAALESRICAEAKKIKEKYICAPHTTDFAILFVPTEGLYAELLRRPGLCDGLQRDHRVMLAGPTTLSAILSSLSMGFRTLTIQQRSSEAWEVLSAVKTEFSKFGDVLDKVHKKLQEASNTVDKARQSKRTMDRKMKAVETMPSDRARQLLQLDALIEVEPEEDTDA